MINILLAVIYLAFISLGLPDALLGAAWPTMSHDVGAQISWAGGISMVISAGTIISCALEQTAGLWASSYMVLHGGVSRVVAAAWASLFYVGITVGRFVSGLLTMRFNDATMIRIGQCVILFGILVLLLPLPNHIELIAGFVIIGLGSAPVYPCIIHSTPHYFGADKSQAIVGMQMASAYIGSMLMPAIFGLIAQNVSMVLLPAYLLILLAVMTFMHIRLKHAFAHNNLSSTAIK